MKTTEPIVIVTMPVSKIQDRIAGTEHKCYKCGCDVTVTYATMNAALDAGSDIAIICINCAEFKDDDKIIPLSEEQIKEIQSKIKNSNI